MRSAVDEATRGTIGGASGPVGAAGLHACLLERAFERLLYAPGVSRRQRARPGGDYAPVPAPGGGAVRRGAPDEDPRAGGVGPVVQGGGRAPGGATADARGGAG